MTTMAYTVVDAATNAIKRHGTCPDTQFQYQCQAGEAIIDGEYPGDVYYYDGQQMQLLPASPGPVYRWDSVAMEWVDPRTADQLRELHTAAIEAERDRRVTATPLVYDSCNLDADAASIERLSNKLATVRIMVDRGDTPDVATLVWRDFDNETHEFADLASYRDWLEGFALALDARGTQAFAWSWQKKADLAALGDDLAQLRGFDATS